MSTPSFLTALRAIVEARLADLHTSMPARVVSYDSATQRATVQPLIRDAEGTLLPIVHDVPVVFPVVGGGGLTFVVAAGDTGLLQVAESSTERWRAGDGSATDAGDDRRFSLTDAFFLPGARAAPISDFVDDATHVRGDKVYLGPGTFVETPGAASNAVVTGEQNDTFTGQPLSLLMVKTPKVFSK